MTFQTDIHKLYNQNVNRQMQAAVNATAESLWTDTELLLSSPLFCVCGGGKVRHTLWYWFVLI